MAHGKNKMLVNNRRYRVEESNYKPLAKAIEEIGL